jgi:hypothetical protein
LQVYNGSAWIDVSTGYGVATGGTSSSITVGGQNYTLLAFTSSSTLTVSKAGLFDILLVGGGGGGGNTGSSGFSEGGGGGSGAEVAITTVYADAGSYTVVVAGGGAADTNPSEVPVHAPYSYITELQLFASGGVGGGPPWSGGRQGFNGSGASYRGGLGGRSGGIAIVPLGFNGGNSDGGGNNGGGGGAGGAGGTRTRGAGVTIGFTGTNLVFGEGGLGGGTTGTIGTAPSANRGGGGSGSISTGAAQNGGSGIVCVRFKV